jgi:hypothetical protein
MTRQNPLFFDQMVESARIILGSRLGKSYGLHQGASLLRAIIAEPA